MKIKSTKKKGAMIALMLIGASLLPTTNAFADNCSSNVAQGIINAAATAISQDQQREKHASDLSSDDSILGCSDVFPTGSLGISLPSISSVLKNIAEKAMNQACDAARNAIQSQVEKATTSVTLNTSMIKGFSSLGLGDINLGTAGISGGTGSSSSLTINGGGWSNLSSAISSSTSSFQ